MFKKVDDNLVIVGSKEIGTYMNALTIISKNHRVIRLVARGRNIVKAADLALWAKRTQNFGINKTVLSDIELPAREDVEKMIRMSEIEIQLMNNGSILNKIQKHSGKLLAIILPIAVFYVLANRPALGGTWLFIYTVIKSFKELTEG